MNYTILTKNLWLQGKIFMRKGKLPLTGLIKDPLWDSNYTPIYCFYEIQYREKDVKVSKKKDIVSLLPTQNFHKLHSNHQK